MQTLIQIQCKAKTPSLRSAIYNAPEELGSCCLKISEKRKGKNKWLSLSSSISEIKGAIKIEWNANTNLLTARIVNRSKVIPSDIIGHFTSFMLWQYGNSIISINIVTQK